MLTRLALSLAFCVLLANGALFHVLRAKRQSPVAIAPVFSPKDEPPPLIKDSNRCNSESLEKVMIENIGDDVKQSKLRIMEAAEALLGGTFNVICAHGDFSYITSTRLYCLTGNDAVKCYAFLSYNQNVTEEVKK